MPLPLHYLFVAGLGRRFIGPRDSIRNELIGVLKHIAAAAPDAQPVALASGAAGADQVFLEAAESLGWPIRLFLPVPAYLFETDFTSTRETDGKVVTETDEIGLTIFKRFSTAATQVEVIDPSPTRRVAFTRCASALIAEADVVVALWDSQPGKQGGTNESLLVAQQLKVPLITLDAQTARPIAGKSLPPVTDLSVRYLARHAKGTILDDIDQALALSLSQPEREKFAAAPVSDQQPRLGRLLGTRAEDLASAYRQKNLYAVVLHAAASLVGLAALLFLTHNPKVGIGATVLKFLAVAGAFWLAHSAKKLGQHNQWVKARFVREVNRSLDACGDVSRQTGAPLESFIPSSIWVLFRYLRGPLLLFYRQHLRTLPGSDLLDSLRSYREKRLSHHADFRSKPWRELSQHDYHRRKGEDSSHLHHWIERAFLWATIAFFACCAALLLIPDFEAYSIPYRLAKWLTVLLPVLSAALLVLPNLWDLHRRRRVGPALARTLARLDGEADEVEKVLTALVNNETPKLQDGTSVWAGSPAEQTAFVEAWARTRFVTIAHEAEHAILTEIIGFKSFVENAELG